jgi:hypothetical protein
VDSKFGFDFGDGLDGVTGGQDLGVVGTELLGEVLRASEGAISFFVEAQAEGGEGGCKERVVLGVALVYGEAGFEGGSVESMD